MVGRCAHVVGINQNTGCVRAIIIQFENDVGEAANEIVIVTRLADEGVVAGVSVERVVARTTVDRVVATSSVDGIMSIPCEK